LEGLITKPEVEHALLLRLRKKAATYAQDIVTDGVMPNGSSKIDVDGVVDLYESFIIPLTKEVEVGALEEYSISDLLTFVQVEYLLHRLDGLSQTEIDKLANNSRSY